MIPVHFLQVFAVFLTPIPGPCPNAGERDIAVVSKSHEKQIRVASELDPFTLELLLEVGLQNGFDSHHISLNLAINQMK